MCRARQTAEWDRAALLASMWSDEPPSAFHPFAGDSREAVEPYDPAVLQQIQDSGLF